MFTTLNDGKGNDIIYFILDKPSQIILNYSGLFTETYNVEFTEAQYKYLKKLPEEKLQRKILSLLCLGKLKTTLIKKETLNWLYNLDGE